MRTSSSGRLQPFDLLNFKKFEGPLSVKAVIQNLAPETLLANDRSLYTGPLKLWLRVDLWDCSIQ